MVACPASLLRKNVQNVPVFGWELPIYSTDATMAAGMRFHWLQHVEFENAAGIGVWAEQNGFTVTQTRLYADDPLHLEYSAQSIHQMLAHCGHELVQAPFIQPSQQITAGLANVQTTNQHLFIVLTALLNLAQS